MSEVKQPQAADAPVVDFSVGEEAPTLVHCSRHECPNGHEWAPRLVAVNCPGCKEPILALMMVNCPVCNEPTKATHIRVDHLPHGGAIMPLCKGGDTMAECTLVTLHHTHAATTAQEYAERPMVSKV